MDEKRFLVDVFGRKQRLCYWILVCGWGLALYFFFSWWFQKEHVVTLAGIVLNTLLILYNLLMPGYFFFFLGRMKKPNPEVGPPLELRVAMVTTIVPTSEPWEVVEKTLRGMIAQKGYSHDVWLLDEGNDPTIKRRCQEMGVKYFSRKGVKKYNQGQWPFKAHTKAGNYNSWYDAIGYSCYDIVVQMDTDHVPQANYLIEMLRPFADPEVAYVAAPSICDGNSHESWVVKARAEIEATLHGPLQSGYNSGFAPLMIGSHYAVRTSSLKQIGGLRETLAEDHSTTLALVSAGFKGVFAPDAIAIGDGAPSFPDAMVQEYQWARALMEILLKYFPKWSRSLPIHLFGEFLFAETWYPVFSLSLLVAYALPLIAILTGVSWVKVSYPAFLWRYSLLTLFCLMMVAWVKKQGWLRPPEARIVSWRTILFQLARWPWILMGCGEACWCFLTRNDLHFRITPKGARGPKPLPIRIVLPYLAIVAFSSGIAIFGNQAGEAKGYYYFALLGSGVYVGLLGAVIVLHLKENHLKLSVLTVSPLWRRQVAIALMAAVMFISGCVTRGAEAFSAISWIPAPVKVVAKEEIVIEDEMGVESTSVPKIIEVKTLIATAQSPRPTVMPKPTVLPVVSLPQETWLGVYDPYHVFPEEAVAIEEVFLPWRLQDTSELQNAIETIRRRGHIPLVVIEPWPFGIEGLSGETLLSDISDGRYDEAIRLIAKEVVKQKPQSILVRWGHEMELTGLYPWAQGDPQKYIAAYRHVVDVFRDEKATNILWIWSPAGNSGCQNYWPGEEYVDYIGVTILASEEWDQAAGLVPLRSFATLMTEKYWLADLFQKPIIATEVGVSATEDEKSKWLKEAILSWEQFPDLVGWIYFNQQQPLWMNHAGTPHWELNPAQIEEICQTWQSQKEPTTE
jgi:cellulose synthase (UDP-forming)